MSWIHEDDFTATVRFIIDDDALARPVNLTSPEPVQQRDLMRGLRAAWEVPVGLPATRWTAEIGALAIRTDTKVLLKSRRAVPARLTAAGFEFQHSTWLETARDLVRRAGYAEIANCATGLSSLTAAWATAPSGASRSTTRPDPTPTPWPACSVPSGPSPPSTTAAGEAAPIRVNTSLAQTALLEQMPFAVDGADADPFRGRDTSSATYRIYEAADRPAFVAITAGDLPEALRRLGAAPAGDLQARIASRTAEACVRALCSGRSAASPVETPSSTMAPDSFWARRGLRLERPSEDFGTVVTQAPVARFTRTPAVAGDTPRSFGQDQPNG